MNLSFTVALALGLMLNGGWSDARPNVTAAVTERTTQPLNTENYITASTDWKAHVTFKGAGREITLVSDDQFASAEACYDFLRSAEIRAGMFLLLAQLKELDEDSFMIAECAQVGTPI